MAISFYITNQRALSNEVGGIRVMTLSFPNPVARDCDKGCGVPVVTAKTPTGNQTVHTGTWQNKCTPKREDKR